MQDLIQFSHLLSDRRSKNDCRVYREFSYCIRNFTYWSINRLLTRYQWNVWCVHSQNQNHIAQIFSKEVTKTVNFFQPTLPLTKVPAKRMLKRHLLVQRFLEKIPPRQNPLQVLFINLKLKLYSWYICVFKNDFEVDLINQTFQSQKLIHGKQRSIAIW